MNKRYISVKIKNEVLINQNGKCANNTFINLHGYKCLLWKYQNGNFDEAGCQYDHINEFSLTNCNDKNNIQALCPSCHSVKTRVFMNNKRQFLSKEIIDGKCIMDIDK